MAALPPYHQHLMAHRFTLLCRFFGLHRVQHRSGRVVYFVVMGNVFPIDKPIHERCDMQGPRALVAAASTRSAARAPGRVRARTPTLARGWWCAGTT